MRKPKRSSKKVFHRKRLSRKSLSSSQKMLHTQCGLYLSSEGSFQGSAQESAQESTEELAEESSEVEAQELLEGVPKLSQADRDKRRSVSGPTDGEEANPMSQ